MTHTLLLITHVPSQIRDKQLGIDDQTCQGLIRWAEHFDHITMTTVQLPQSAVETPATWQAIADLSCAKQVSVIPLPYAYTLPNFIQTYQATRQLLRKLIQANRYLCFTLGAIVGDWAAIACLEAQRQNRAYAVWTDRVEYEVLRRTAAQEPLQRRFKYLFTLPVMKYYHQLLVRRSSLGLFQGQECFQEFSPFCSQPHCVYDTHIQQSDHIRTEQLERKIENILSGEPLKICYLGRATSMKGGLDWVRSLQGLKHSGFPFEATWFGDGPLLAEMKALAEQLHLDQWVSFPGFVSDRATIIEILRCHHIFLFCHRTPESPRCLIEALISGCPLVGYHSAYPEGLIAHNGGGLLTPSNDWQFLGEALVKLVKNRPQLATLVRASATAGAPFNERRVFQHRSDLLKQHLP
jgi:glycosyltransferase involved in cell wall biosynthesis